MLTHSELETSITKTLAEYVATARIPELIMPLGKLLQHYAGFEEYLECEAEYPESRIISLLDDMKKIPLSKRVVSFVRRLSNSDLFTFHAHTKCEGLKTWGPLEETFFNFTSQGRRAVVVWQDERYRINPASVEKWLLKNSLRIIHNVV